MSITRASNQVTLQLSGILDILRNIIFSSIAHIAVSHPLETGFFSNGSHILITEPLYLHLLTQTLREEGAAHHHRRQTRQSRHIE